VPVESTKTLLTFYLVFSHSSFFRLLQGVDPTYTFDFQKKKKKLKIKKDGIHIALLLVLMRHSMIVTRGCSIITPRVRNVSIMFNFSSSFFSLSFVIFVEGTPLLTRSSFLWIKCILYIYIYIYIY
jgi:hypothetical protein